MGAYRPQGLNIKVSLFKVPSFEAIFRLKSLLLSLKRHTLISWLLSSFAQADWNFRLFESLIYS
jgi:hypothetical protein